MKIKLFIPCLCLFILIVSGCTYDNIEKYYSIDNCDLTDVTFSKTIDPIIDRNCKGCHYQGNSTGITLITYADIVDEAESGKLLGSIKHSPGFEPMPIGGKLDECTIQKIEAWINDGALNN